MSDQLQDLEHGYNITNCYNLLWCEYLDTLQSKVTLNISAIRAHRVHPVAPHPSTCSNVVMTVFSPPLSVSLCPPSQFQLTSASQSSWGWSALLKVMLTVSFEGGDRMSPSLSAHRFRSLPGDLNWWLSSFKSFLQTMLLPWLCRMQKWVTRTTVMD